MVMYTQAKGLGKPIGAGTTAEAGTASEAGTTAEASATDQSYHPQAAPGGGIKMSRAQGDYYKTHTDQNLNAYRARLDEKLRKLTDHKTKWYRFGEGWILTEEQNRMINRRGHWKWDGWEVEAHEYWIKVFPAECVTVKDGVPTVIGLAQDVKVIDDDKAAANAYFQNVAKPLAKDLTTWIPREANNGVFLNYKGRKPSAVIIIDWEGDSYFFKLVVDGAEVMSSKSREELKAEAERLGAVLEETHTP